MRKLLHVVFVLTFLLPVFVFSQTCIAPTGGTITGSDTGCTDRVGTYTVSGVSNATSYVWDIQGAQGFTKISETQYSIVFAGTNVTILVTPVNAANGPCSGVVLSKAVTVSAAPSKPIIVQTGSTLSASTASSYQWYSGSLAISGAITQTYVPTVNGLYSVEVKNASGCNTFSDSFNYIKTSIREDGKFKNFSFYPNPVVNTLNTNFSERYDLEFLDLAGRKVLQNLNLNGEQKTDLSSLNQGIYIMRISSGDKKAIRKLLVK